MHIYRYVGTVPVIVMTYEVPTVIYFNIYIHNIMFIGMHKRLFYKGVVLPQNEKFN